MKILKVIFWIFLIGFLVIQFIPVDKNIDTSTVSGTAFFEKYDVPSEAQKILKTSCFDCHSNNTNYQWYHKVQPGTWYIQSHVNEGKEELNFDEFNSYSAKKQQHKLEESIEMIEEGEMPLSSYTLIHRDAKLSNDEKKQLVAMFRDLLKTEN